MSGDRKHMDRHRVSEKHDNNNTNSTNLPEDYGYQIVVI